MMMPAVLKTKNGFFRYIQVDYPPPREMNIPNYNYSYSRTFGWSENVGVDAKPPQVLEFRLDRIENNVVFYREH